MKNMIFGTYEHSVDKKNRMFLPAKVREYMGENIIMVKSLSGKCIALYPEAEWEKFEEKLEALPKITASDVFRKVYSSLSIVQTDANGRILIPQNLCEYAELEKNVVVIGVGTHAEIWSDVNRAAQCEKENSPDLLDTLREIGL